MSTYFPKLMLKTSYLVFFPPYRFFSSSPLSVLPVPLSICSPSSYKHLLSHLFTELLRTLAILRALCALPRYTWGGFISPRAVQGPGRVRYIINICFTSAARRLNICGDAKSRIGQTSLKRLLSAVGIRTLIATPPKPVEICVAAACWSWRHGDKRQLIVRRNVDKE